MKKPIWLTISVSLLIFFGLLNIIYGIFTIIAPKIFPRISYILGAVSIAFGIFDLIAAYVVWKTKKPWFIIFLFFPVVWLSFEAPAPTDVKWLIFPMLIIVTGLVFLIALVLFFLVQQRFE